MATSTSIPYSDSWEHMAWTVSSPERRVKTFAWVFASPTMFASRPWALVTYASLHVSPSFEAKYTRDEIPHSTSTSYSSGSRACRSFVAPL